MKTAMLILIAFGLIMLQGCGTGAESSAPAAPIAETSTASREEAASSEPQDVELEDPADEPVDEQDREEAPDNIDNGLTPEEVAQLQADKMEFESLSAEEQAALRESGAVGCVHFVHLYWEELISMELINHVGAERADTWFINRMKNDECTDIYSFAKEFRLDYDALETLIIDNGLESIYPLDRLKQRYARIF